MSYEFIKLIEFLKKRDFRFVITGRPRSGKSAFMYFLAELFHRLNPRVKIYVVNFPKEGEHLLPSYINRISQFEIAEREDCLILIELSIIS